MTYDVMPTPNHASMAARSPLPPREAQANLRKVNEGGTLGTSSIIDLVPVPQHRGRSKPDRELAPRDSDACVRFSDQYRWNRDTRWG